MNLSSIFYEYWIIIYRPNLKYRDSGCFLFFMNKEAISIPVTEKVIPFPPNPNTK